MSGERHESNHRHQCCAECPQPCGEEQGEVTLDGAVALYDFLQGRAPPCLELESQPRVDGKTAFAIIYYLQEVLRIIPDNYERCEGCGGLIDVYCDGYWDEYNGHYCCNCSYRLDGEKQEAP